MRNYTILEKDLEYLRQNVEQLNVCWNINDPPIQRRKGIFGGLVVLIKRCIRKAVYWLMRPYWDQQTAFNQITCAAISDIYRIQSGLIHPENMEKSDLPEDEMALVEGPRVIQLVSTLSPGDAVGNEVLAFKRTLRENGFATEIYASHISRGIPAGAARYYRELPPLRENDLVIYHFASECAIAKDIKTFPCKVILRYHNVTPPMFFHGFDVNAEKATANGLQQIRELQPYIDFCLPVSAFNQQDLREMGYTCPMKVLPILIRFEDYAKEPDQKVIERYSDGVTNLLFVGRMAPNKKVEDVISAFACYKKQYDPTARLFLVGSFQESDHYYQFLQKHIQKLHIQDVVFPGHIPFSEILAYYRVANVFVCMSEHEGFCVPLVEAMYFGVPIVAYDSSAVGDTLGGCGVLLEDKAPEKAAAAISMALSTADPLRKKMDEQLKTYGKERITEQFLTQLYEQMDVSV